MPLAKDQVKEAFREAMASVYADVPPADQLDHEFSPDFYAKMEAFIERIRESLKSA